jgi:hypothetical protein
VFVVSRLIPPSLDVVLEGGALTLERALLDYRRLARLVKGDWQLRGFEVEALAKQCSARELEVAEVEARALHRATLEASVAPARGLVDEVRRARGVLCRELKTPPGRLCVALELLADEAHEATLVGRAWRGFRFERALWSVGVLAALGTAPLVSWRAATRLGAVTLDFVALLETPGPRVGVLATLVAVLASQLRFDRWRWLHGVRAPGWAVTLWLCAAVMVGCLVPPLQRSATGFVVFVACTGLVARTALPWWRSRSRDPHACEP